MVAAAARKSPLRSPLGAPSMPCLALTLALAACATSPAPQEPTGTEAPRPPRSSLEELAAAHPKADAVKVAPQPMLNDQALRRAGLPRPLQDLLVGVSANLRRDGVDLEAHWRSWADRLLKAPSGPKKKPVPGTLGRDYVGLATETAVIAQIGLRGETSACAIARPGESAHKAGACLTVGRLAAAAIEACRIDATLQHVVRLLVAESKVMAPRVSGKPGWAVGWLTVNGELLGSAGSLYDRLVGDPRRPWLWGPDRKPPTDAALRARCAFQLADGAAGPRLTAWLSAKAADAIHPVNAEAALLLGATSPRPADFVRAREWLALLRAVDAPDMDLLVVNAARQRLRRLRITARGAGRLSIGVGDGDEDGAGIPVTVGRRRTPTPLMLAEFNRDKSLDLYPRWSPAKPPKGELGKRAFRCPGRSGSGWELLHNPLHPLGSFRFAPYATRRLPLWSGDEGNKTLRVPPSYYIHGTPKEAQFEAPDGERAASTGCVRAPGSFLYSLLKREVGDRPSDWTDCPLRPDQHCWAFGTTTCKDPSLAKRACRREQLEHECRKTVPLRREGGESARPLFMIFAYFECAGAEMSTCSDPYQLGDRAVQRALAPIGVEDVASLPEETTAAREAAMDELIEEWTQEEERLLLGLGAP